MIGSPIYEIGISDFYILGITRARVATMQAMIKNPRDVVTVDHPED